MICTYCKKDGYTEDICFKKMRDNGNTPNYPTSAAVVLLCYDACLLTSDSKNLHSKSLLSNSRAKSRTVEIGDNTEVQSLGAGTFMGFHLKEDNKNINLMLKDVLLVPDLWVNLLSITKATSTKNCKVICEENLITVNTNS
jgi:hypothetical protein